MEISFVKAGAEEASPAIPVEAAVNAAVDTAPVAAVPTTTAVVPATPVAVSTPSSIDVLDDDNIGFEDVILPRINIVQKVGDLSNIFNSGEIVLNQQQVIYEPPNEKTKSAGTGPLVFTVLGFRRRQYTEKVEGGKLGLLLNDEADIAKNGGTLDYKEWQASLKAAKDGTGKALKLFYRLATALILVQCPGHIKDEDHVLFPYELEGKYYALALWSMKGTAYTNAAKPIFTAKKLGHLRSGYTTSAWSLSTELKPFGDNYAWVPKLGVAGRNSDSFRSLCREILTGGN